MHTIEKIKELKSSYSNGKAIHTALDVVDFFKGLLLLLTKDFESKTSYFIWINPYPEKYENIIERVLKTFDFEFVDFDWWERDDSTYIPIAQKNDSFNNTFINEYKENLFSDYSQYRLIPKDDFLNSIKEHCIEKCYYDNIETNYKSFGENLLVINIGQSEITHGYFILSIENSTAIKNINLELLSCFLNTTILNYLIQIKTQRDRLIPEFSFELSNLEFGNPDYFNTLIEKIIQLFQHPKNKGESYCSEIGVFERFANRINIIPTNYKTFFENSAVRDVFENKPLTIGNKYNTSIEYSAYRRLPYYIESVNNRKKIYRKVIKETKSQFTIPLELKDKVYGVLNIGLEAEYGFLPCDRKLLIALSGQIANAIKHKTFKTLQLGITNKLSNKLLLLKSDEGLLSSIEYLSPRKHEIADVFYNYMSSVHKDFSFYNGLLSSFKTSTINVCDIFNESRDKIIAYFENQEELVNKGLKIADTDLLNSKVVSKVITKCSASELNIIFNRQILLDSFISILMHKLKNCTRRIKKEGFNTEIKTYLNISISKNISLEFKDNGIEGDSKFLYKRFRAIDYPKQIVIKKEETLNEYYGIPFISIEDFCHKMNATLLIKDNDFENTLTIKIPQNN